MSLIKSYGTTHFLMNGMSCILQDTLGVLCLTFLQKFEAILKKLKFCEILGILNNFDLRTVIYAFYGIEMYEIYRKNKFSSKL